MTRARVFPHRRASTESITWGEWVVSRDGGPAEAVGERLTAWDYSTVASFGTTVVVDDVELLGSTGLEDLADVDVVVVVDCPASGHRFRAAAPLDRARTGDEPIVVEVPAGHLADRARLSAHLILNTLKPADGTRAFKPSSRLLESPTTTVALEGDLHRFPTEAVSFAALRLEPAAWTVRASFTDLSDSFVGSVRLLINTDHPASSQLIAMSGPHAPALHAFLRLDVARNLITSVAADRGIDIDGDVDRAGEGSLRAGLEALCSTFLSMDLADAVEIARQDPARFERSLQVGFEFLQDVGP